MTFHGEAGIRFHVRRLVTANSHALRQDVNHGTGEL